MKLKYDLSAFLIILFIAPAIAQEWDDPVNTSD